ncbi:MAG: transglutaminase domain-containing protein [Promethearchaeota archaeon]
MPMRKRAFLGRLVKKTVIKKVSITSLLVVLLLVAWFSLPALWDLILGNGNRGGYNTHDDIPDDWTTYPQIPLNFNFTPDILFNLSALNGTNGFNLSDIPIDLFNLLDPNSINLTGDFSNFNLSNFDIPVFTYEDINGYSPITGREMMRQSVYDTLSADGSSWSKSQTSTVNLPPQYQLSEGESWVRVVRFNLTSLQTVTLRTPMFPYEPRYVDNSLSSTGDNWWDYNYGIPDDGAMKMDPYEVVSTQFYANSSPGNLTYYIQNDYSMDPGQELWYNSSWRRRSDTILDWDPSNFSNALQIPGNDLSNYLATRPSFNSVYSNISSRVNVNTDSMSHIMWVIKNKLEADYSYFTGMPIERPPSGQDMVEWFLSRPAATFTNGSGTPYDFASAFVLLARAFGIPARMVTGWWDYENDNIIQIGNIYAWAEAFYFDSYDTGRYIMKEFLPVGNGGVLPNETFGNITGGLGNLTNSYIDIIQPPDDQVYYAQDSANVTFTFNCFNDSLEIVGETYYYDVLDSTSTSIFPFPQPIHPVPFQTIGVSDSFNISVSGDYELYVFCQLNVSGTPTPLYSAPKPFSVAIVSPGNASIEITNPVEGETLNNGVVNTNSETIVVSLSYSNPVLDIYFEVDGTPTGTNYTLPTLSSATTGTLANGNHTIQAFMRTSGITPTYVSSSVVNFTVDAEDGFIIINEPLPSSSYTYPDRMNIPLNFTVTTSSSITAMYFSVTGASSIPLTAISGNTTFSTTSNGIHTLTVTVQTDRGILSAFRIFNITQNNFLTVDINGTQAFTNAVLETDSLLVTAHAYTSGGSNISGVNVTFFDVSDGVLLGSGLTDANGNATLLLDNSNLPGLSTGVHAIQVTLDTVPSILNYTLFAIDRPMTLTITGFTPSTNLVRSNGGTIPGTTFTVTGTLNDSTGAGIDGAMISVNLDNQVGGADLRYTTLQAQAASNGQFVWLGEVDIAAAEGARQINVSFDGVVHHSASGIDFYFSNTARDVQAVNVIASTVITVDFSPRSVSVFDFITINGTLHFDNGSAIASETVDITIEFIVGGVTQSTDVTTATTNGSGFYSISYQVLEGSDTIRITASYTPASPYHGGSSQYVEG